MDKERSKQRNEAHKSSHRETNTRSLTHAHTSAITDMLDTNKLKHLKSKTYENWNSFVKHKLITDESSGDTIRVAVA